MLNQILKLSEAVKEGKGYGEGGYLCQCLFMFVSF